MIDDGQAVDIKGISEKPLMKHLNKLFLSLNLKEKGDRVFLLRPQAPPTLEVIGDVIALQTEATEQKTEDALASHSEEDVRKDDVPPATIGPTFEASAPRRRFVLFIVQLWLFSLLSLKRSSNSSLKICQVCCFLCSC